MAIQVLSRRTFSILLVLLMQGVAANPLSAQSDSVDVTFYYKPDSNPSVVYIAGEFNNWANNSSGVISDIRFAMVYNPITEAYEKTYRLRIGGLFPLPHQNAVAGAYQYKFNETGAVSGWTNDPLNPRQNSRDNNNTYLFIQDPTIHYLLPNSRSGLVTSSSPVITAYVFPGTVSSVDTSSMTLTVDDTMLYTHLGSYYEAATHKLEFPVPDPLLNGAHKIVISAACAGQDAVEDSAFFSLQAGFMQFLTRSDPKHLRQTQRVEGVVSDTSLRSVTLIHNGDSIAVPLNQGFFSREFDLTEGHNLFEGIVFDSTGAKEIASPISIEYQVDHAPKPVIISTYNGGSMMMRVEGNDPESDPLTFHWAEDPFNPESLSFTEAGTVITFDPPGQSGEYIMHLTAVDPDSNLGLATAMFTVLGPDSIALGNVNTNPAWVQNAIVYEIYVPAFTAAGTFDAMKQQLDWIESLGANVIWLMPIYENGELINSLNAGYNVTDFYSVHPQFGSMDDFDGFVEAAHQRGIRIILDSTPNHVSGSHPWVKDIELYQDYSLYRPMIETRLIGSDSGLGHYVTYDNGYGVYAHYSNWSLANLNYDNPEPKAEMLDMYKWWLEERDIDGFRMDVYWGPQTRYGSSVWWRPFREEIKRLYPDTFILGEAGGTGSGTEALYADGGGGADAAYDWSLFSQVKNTLSGGSISGLNERVVNYSPNLNYNHHTGPNAHYFRFLENHDESRIASLYPGEKSRAGALILMTIPGIPLVYAGQEVGETSRRGQINWTRTGADDYFDHYQKLIHIRKQFPAFSSKRIKTLYTGPAKAYAYLRPHTDQNGFAVVNLSSSINQIILNFNNAELMLSTDSLLTGETYYLNDLLNDTVTPVSKSDLENFTVTLNPWRGAVYVLADSAIQMSTSVVQEKAQIPEQFKVRPNYPNPFNASTTISFTLPGADAAETSVVIYNMLGERIQTLVSGLLNAGNHTFRWHGRDDSGRECASGMYLLRIVSGHYQAHQKMLLLR